MSDKLSLSYRRDKLKVYRTLAAKLTHHLTEIGCLRQRVNRVTLVWRHVDATNSVRSASTR
jgi:hypothetical protein